MSRQYRSPFPRPIFMEQLESRRLLTGDIQFAEPDIFDTGGGPDALATADVNGDSHVDLIVNNTIFGEVSGVRVLLGRGDGTFDSPITAPFMGIGLATADLDGDGDVDVATARVGRSQGIHVGLNEGVAGDQWQGVRHVFFPMPSYDAPQAIAAGDLDGDQDIDIVVGDPHRVPVFFNKGTLEGEWQGFEDPVDQPGGSHSSRVVLADIDGDGDLDLVVGHYSGSKISVRVGNGDGTFKSPEAHRVSGNVVSLDTGDLDGDGDLDIVVGTYTRNIELLLQQTDGGFDRRVIQTTEREYRYVTLADFDGDQDLDLAAGGESGVRLLVNNGEGELTNLGTPFPFPTYQNLTSADLDGDGRPDLAGIFFPSESVGVLLNRTEQFAALPGDANRDGVFNSTDLVLVFQAGEYEDGISGNSTWEEGDWNDDGEFDSGDLIAAFQAGHYLLAANPLRSQIAAAIDLVFTDNDGKAND